MLARTLLAIVVSVAVAAPALGSASASSASAPSAAMAKKKAKKCKKGKVRRGGKCVKRAAKAPATPVAPVAPVVPVVPPAPVGTPAPTNPAIPATGSPEAAARFTELLAGSALKRVYASTGAYSSTQGNDTYSFCASGTMRYYGEYIGTVTASTTRWSGTWKVDKAGFSPDGNIGEAVISYTTDGSADAPPPGQTIVRVQAKGPAYMGASSSDSREYSWVRGGASC